MSAGTLSVVSDGIYIANVTSGPNLAIQMPALPSAYFDFAFAGKPNPFGSYRTLMAQQVGGQHHMLIEVGTNKLGIYAASWFPAGSLEWPPVDGQAYYSGADASNIRIGRDGNGLIEIVGENLTADNAPCLLNYSVGGGQGFGTAREFVFMTATRSQDIQDRVSGYLAWKWDGILGVTTHVDALPVGHPYKAAAPTTGAVSVIGSATLDAARSEIIATGEAVTTTVTGTGALFQQGVSLSGVGLVQTLYTGTGALVTVSTLAASGTVSALGTGALVTSASATGAGTSLSGGTAALAPAPAVLTGKQGDVLQAGELDRCSATAWRRGPRLALGCCRARSRPSWPPASSGRSAPALWPRRWQRLRRRVSAAGSRQWRCSRVRQPCRRRWRCHRRHWYAWCRCDDGQSVQHGVADHASALCRQRLERSGWL